MNQSELKVIFLGPYFTFSHEAALSMFPRAQFFYDFNPRTIFEKVHSEEMDFGILPAENSATGIIQEFFPLLLDQDYQLFSKEVKVRIVKELYLPIYHHLLARSNLPVAEIGTLYTHRQPYLQCADWVSAHLKGVRVEFTDSTAVAAEKLAQDPKGACIGGNLLSEQQQLLKLRTNIQDYSKNVTRFFAITSSHAKIPPHSDKTTLSIIIPNEVGTLVQTLQMIAKQEVNLVNIKTLPVRAANVFPEDFKDWFIVDIATGASSKEFADLLSQFDEHHDLVLSYKVLGSYPGSHPIEVAKRKERNVRQAKLDASEDLEEMMRNGESENVEFKASLRYDFKTKQVNKELQKAVAKTLAGFMNSRGGYLFIGVTDSGEPVGIDDDVQLLPKKTLDNFLSVLYQTIEDMIDKEHSQYVHPKLVTASGKTICCVKVDVSTKAAWISDAGTHTLFIRAGNRTTPLDPKDANEYILSRFR